MCCYHLYRLREMTEKLLLPKKVNIKTKPYGSGEELFMMIQAETLTDETLKFSTFVTKELCIIILQFLERGKFMKCLFDGDKLICVNNKLTKILKPVGQSQILSGLEGVPVGATFYATNSRNSLYAFIRVSDLTLTGKVSSEWAEFVVEGIVDRLKLIFIVEDDKKDREN